MERYYGKFGVFSGIITFVLLVIGLRNVLGHDVEVLNFVTFVIFGLIIGISFSALLFYQLKIAFPIFGIAMIIAFFDMFRSFILDINGQGDVIGILSLFIISSFGLGLSLLIEFIVRLIRKNKNTA
ncbi:hypothetical protein [Sporosarcina ureilytica]|uniref:Permease n=1 Tax=Sporosarcina ureilytica TaxID=298596 RepID=A0A1D8JEK2_9BACL|nr:hypothetical protein [Sporosarcina ureilytica]AOV07113.1 hypothetical protein BI350_05860 [Sporosarcina ureilytica]